MKQNNKKKKIKEIKDLLVKRHDFSLSDLGGCWQMDSLADFYTYQALQS